MRKLRKHTQKRLQRFLWWFEPAIRTQPKFRHKVLR